MICNGASCGYCSPCPDGQISIGAQTSCTRCPPGTHSDPTHTSCTPCAIGTASIGGSSSCDDCDAPGDYSPTTGLVVCKVALPGSEVSATNGIRSSSTPCPVGRYSTGFVDDCSACEIGKYAASPGSQTCSFCSNVVKGSTTTSEGTRSASDCGCEVGYFKSDATGHCEFVGEGISMDVPSMNVTNLHMEPKFWRNSDQSMDVRRCFADDACLGGADASAYCEEGHEGPYCGVCSDGYSEVGISLSTMRCEKCTGSTTTTVALGATFLVLFLILPCIYLYYKRRKNKGTRAADHPEETAMDIKKALAKKKQLEKKAKTANTIRNNVQTISKILLSYAQIVSGFSFNFGIR